MHPADLGDSSLPCPKTWPPSKSTSPRVKNQKVYGASQPSMLSVSPTCYRTRFFVRVARVALPPLVAVLVVQDACRLAPLRALALYVVSLPLWIAASVAYSSWTHRREARQVGARTIPRVRGKWPGNLDVMLRLSRNVRGGYLLQEYANIFEEYGPTVNLRLLWTDVIMSCDDLHLRFAQATGAEHFERGEESQERMSELLGNGIFVSDGETWQRHRAMTRPFFVKERISDFDIFSHHADTTLSLLARAAEERSPVDVQDLFARFTLDAASSFLFGKCTDTLALPLPAPYTSRLGPKGSATDDAFGTFARAFEEAQVIIAERSRLGVFWPLRELGGRRTQPSVDVITAWLEPIVERVLGEKKALMERGLSVEKEETTLLGFMANNTEDKDMIRYELLNILLASRDTTASLLTFVLYFLSLHPEITFRLRQEVLSTCGSDSVPDYTTVRSMKLMRAVLNETLRLFPPAPISRRITNKALILPSHPTSTEKPLYLPQGAMFGWSLVHLHRSKALWGADADVWDPDRWLDRARLERYTRRPSIFTPFIAGPRICPGQNFAYNETSFLLARILQRFSDFELVPAALPEGAAPPSDWKHGQGRMRTEQCWPAAAFTTYVKGGLWVKFIKASE